MVRRFFLTSGNWPRTTDCVVAEQVSVPAAATTGALLRRRSGADEMDAGGSARTSPAAAPERAFGVESAAAAGCRCSESCSSAIAFLRSQLDSPPRQMDMKDELLISMAEKFKESQPVLQRIIETTTDDESMLFEALNLHDELEQVLANYAKLELSHAPATEQVIMIWFLQNNRRLLLLVKRKKKASFWVVLMIKGALLFHCVNEIFYVY